jgi:hypothetical protein
MSKFQTPKVLSYEDEIFENRNQSYGAYVLRKNYARNFTRAFGLAIMLCLATILGYIVYDYQQAKNLPVPFSIKPEVIVAPWNSQHQLLYLRVKYEEKGKLKNGEGEAIQKMILPTCSDFVFAEGQKEEILSKLKVSFNPNKVKAYRFLGYEHQFLVNKQLSQQAAQADTAKNKALGFGHLAAALYEIVPIEAQQAYTQSTNKPLYQETLPETETNGYWQRKPDGLFQLSFRYNTEQDNKTKMVFCNVKAEQPLPLSYASPSCQFAVAVTGSLVK